MNYNISNAPQVKEISSQKGNLIFGFAQKDPREWIHSNSMVEGNAGGSFRIWVFCAHKVHSVFCRSNFSPFVPFYAQIFASSDKGTASGGRNILRQKETPRAFEFKAIPSFLVQYPRFQTTDVKSHCSLSCHCPTHTQRLVSVPNHRFFWVILALQWNFLSSQGQHSGEKAEKELLSPTAQNRTIREREKTSW